MCKPDLKISDRIRIVGLPGEGVPNYYIHRDTRRTYQAIILPGRSVRIGSFDDLGYPWFNFRLRGKNGRLEWHSMMVSDDDNNWIRVKHRKR